MQRRPEGPGSYSQSLGNGSLIFLLDIHSQKDLTLAFTQMTRGRQKPLMEFPSFQILLRVLTGGSQRLGQDFITGGGFQPNPPPPQMVQASVSVDRMEPGAEGATRIPSVDTLVDLDSRFPAASFSPNGLRLSKGVRGRWREC